MSSPLLKMAINRTEIYSACHVVWLELCFLFSAFKDDEYYMMNTYVLLRSYCTIILYHAENKPLNKLDEIPPLLELSVHWDNFLLTTDSGNPAVGLCVAGLFS